jgi:Tol biopolymer transport system component
LVSDAAAYDFVYDIYTVNADGTGFTALTNDIFDFVDYLKPSWSPDGTKLAMAISQRTGINEYDTRIGTMNTDGTGIVVLKPGAAPWSTTSWSADGTRIAYTSLSGAGTDVSWVSADGLASGTIVTNGRNADWQH